MHDCAILLQGLVSGAVWFWSLLTVGTLLLGVGSSAAQPSEWQLSDEGVVSAAGSANWDTTFLPSEQ